jgi:hypothetical protein
VDDMNVVEHLVEWDQIFLRISGRKLQDTVARLLLEKRLPVADVELNFREGCLVAAAKIQKGLSIPIRCTSYEIRAEGRTLRVVLENLSTFGSLPLPKKLLRLVDDLKLPDGISFDAETMTVAVSIDKFLPPYLDLTVKAIRFINGGLALHLGEGNVDIPALPARVG